MPDIGMIELILIGMIAFLILGPERLPDFFAQIAKVVRQGRAWMNSLKMQLAEEKQQLIKPIEDIKQDVSQSIEQISNDQPAEPKSDKAEIKEP